MENKKKCSSKKHSEIDANGQRIYASDGTTQLANIGYGPTAGGSATVTSPYYTLGRRKSGENIGSYSHAEGINTTASAQFSHAEAYETTASGSYSHAEGFQTTASNDGAHAEGYRTTASGNYSHAEGNRTTASGDYSHAGGYYTSASHSNQTVVGRYNADKPFTLFEVGNGGSETYKKNAFDVDTRGDVTIERHITAGGDISINNINASGDITAGGDVTDGTGNVLSNKADKFTIIGHWNGSDAIQDKIIPSGTITPMDDDMGGGSFALGPGIYLCIIFASWTANASGRRYINMAKTTGASSGETRWMADSVSAAPSGVTTQRMVFTLSTSTTDTWHINALQNSGGNLTATIRYNIVKIG